MAVDNPSYFSLRGDSSSTSQVKKSTSGYARTFGGFFRRSKNNSLNSSKSFCSSKTSNKTISYPISISATANNESNLDTENAGNRYGCPRSLNRMSFSGTHHNPGRNIRSLFRSASASADCEKTRQFLQGDPRPSDVAPPSPYLPHRSHSNSDNERRRSFRKNFPKNSTDLLGDIIFCDLPSNEDGRTRINRYLESDNDCYENDSIKDVSLKYHDEPGYYNVTTLPSSTKIRNKQRQERRKRRHSIGTFLEGEVNDETCNSIDTTDLVAANRINETSSNTFIVRDICDVNDYADKMARERSASCSRNENCGTRHGTIPTKIEALSKDDIIFISSKDSETSALWVNYLTACFEQISRQQGRPPFRVSQVPFEAPIEAGMDTKIRNAKLQVIVICPLFLDRVTERPEHATFLTRHLNPNRVLAMMLGVQDFHLNGLHRSSMMSFQNWRKFFVKDQDETFVGQLLSAAVSLLGNTCNGKADKEAFSVHPKKVKMGQNKILALMNEPVRSDDKITVIVDRCGEGIEINHVKRRNPYTLQFLIPEKCLEVSMIVGIRIMKNGIPLGVRQVKCESRLRELDQILRAHDNPLEFMCQTFGFNSGDREQLDNWMVHAFQKNVPPHFNLFSTPSGDLHHHSRNHSSLEENPTLLHFAARFGLEKLSWQLLECPGADIACDMKNINEFTPADLAEQAGHTKLANQLRGYMQMNEFTNMYSYLKVMSEKSNQNLRTPSIPEDPKEDYCRPRAIHESYSVPPTARPILSNNHYLFPNYSSPTSIRQAANSNHQTLTIDETAGNSNLDDNNVPNSSLIINDLDTTLQGQRSLASSSTSSSISSQFIFSEPGNNCQVESKNDMVEQTLKSSTLTRYSTNHQNNNVNPKIRENLEPQDELAEIINDFKNNVYTISECETLVENWKNRNDVKQGFRDKQRQLSLMRDDYERIQKKLRESKKGSPTPFDRIKKFFTKDKKDAKDGSTANNCESTSKKANGVNSNLPDRRPISSLSLHSVSSSSSSGRNSTASRCSDTSLGDSGTHSDADDRRHQSEDNKSGLTNYVIPPAPKPFHGRFSPGKFVPTPRVGIANNELDLRSVKSSPSATEHKEYYIEFPPCGLPIYSQVFKTEPMVKELKTPGTPIDCQFPAFYEEDEKSIIEEPEESEDCSNAAPKYSTETETTSPLDYMNIKRWETEVISTKPVIENVIIKVRPEIHAEPKNVKVEGTVKSNENNENIANQVINNAIDFANQKTDNMTEEPKIDNQNETSNENSKNVPDEQSVSFEENVTNNSTSIEEIAKNFGVTLKKLPGPPVPPRSEFNFAIQHTAEDASTKC